MASTYPTTQDTFTTKVQGGVINEDHINDLQNAVIAVEANVGLTNSADTTTIDYKLKNASSVNPGHKHTLAGALTDVEITSPTDGQGLRYETASGKWKNATTSIADATTAVKGINLMSVAPVSAASPIAVGDNDPRVPTQAENDALVGTSGTAVSSSNKLVDAADVSSAGASGKIVRANGTALPALDGSALTNITNVKNGTFTKDASDASTTQTIAHGLGKIPKRVRFDFVKTLTAVTAIQQFGFAVYNGTTSSGISIRDSSSVSGFTSGFDVLRLNDSTSAVSRTDGVITFDATNITITWTKTNSPTGVYQFIWEAQA